MSDELELRVRHAFAGQWWYSPKMPIEEVLIRAQARLRHDHAEKCSVVVEQLRCARPELTLAEARAILIADEALVLSYDQRLAIDKTFGSAELDAWAALVATAAQRVA